MAALRTIRDVILGIRSDVGRFLMSLGAIAVGMFSLVMLIVVTRGLDNQAESLIRSLGVNVIGVISLPQQKGSNGISINTETSKTIAAAFPGVSISNVRVSSSPTLGTVQKVEVIATDEYLMDIRQWDLLSGRFLDAADLRLRERVAVVSEQLALSWGWTINSIIILGQSTFRVVGVIRSNTGNQDDLNGNDQHLFGNNTVIVPITLQPYWSNQSRKDVDALDAIYLKVNSNQSFPKVLRGIRQILDDPVYDQSTIYLVSPYKLVAGTRTLQNTLNMTLGFLVVLSVGLGGMTMVGLMVANVRERRAEIGLRRAMGATKWQIQLLFVIESIFVSISALAVGLVIGGVVLLMLGDRLPVPVSISYSVLGIPVIVSMASGLVASIWPALLASRIEPCIALRH